MTLLLTVSAPPENCARICVLANVSASDGAWVVNGSGPHSNALEEALSSWKNCLSHPPIR